MDSLTARFQKDVFLPYLDLLKSGYRFHSVFTHAKKMWEEKLTADELVNGPYLEKSQIYQDGPALDELPLHEKTKLTIRKRLGNRVLWKHQTDALQIILNGMNAVVATGTSSGKTLCYQIPILDDLVSDPAPGLRAVIIYPLNALVNDQLTEWEQMLAEHPQIRFARFTGQTPNTQNDYVAVLRATFREELSDQGLTQQELQQKVEQRLAERLRTDIPNRLNHREAIRSNPPQVLITNFSMLEYLLERPVDAPIFENARLKFLVLDEAHAYRGVQATEIGFLVRRIKDRLNLNRLVCVATSATLGKQGDEESQMKVRKFASDLFGEDFNERNPIYGTAAEPSLRQPSFSPTPEQYLKVVESLRDDPNADIRLHLAVSIPANDLASLLSHDNNLFRLRKEILTKPIRLRDAAKALWPDSPKSEEGLEALLDIVATAKTDQSHEDLLPTRLHYFVRAQDGLHVCLHRQCPGRRDGKPAFFVSRKSDPEVPEGDCPDCYRASRNSKLVEIVTCRKCGYLYGALQDMGPRRAQSLDTDGEPKPYFDSFNTELGWVGDSYWSYFGVDDDLPYPAHVIADEEEGQDGLITMPAELQWCVICGKKKDEGAGDNCTCEQPHLRTIRIFHRQCPHTGKAKDHDNLYRQEKSLLPTCPNCGARNGSGIEPVHRFQESDDEMGLSMAVPLAHFQVSPKKTSTTFPRKLLCFTDHRQRAAAFPSLLEEETFSHDMGRKIIGILDREKKPLSVVELGELLADEEEHDQQFFLPVSRLPDEEPDQKARRNLWLAETFAYFGVPDSARESAEDLGLVAVGYRITDDEKSALRKLLGNHTLTPVEADAVLQTLLGYMRQRKAFTLPRGVQPDAPAFGRVTADIAYVPRREGIRNTNGWLPHGNKDNAVTDYLRRVHSLSKADALSMAENIWNFMVSRSLLIENKGKWKLDHERILLTKPSSRYVCNRCGMITAYSAKDCCPKKSCEGTLEPRPFDPTHENIIAHWVSGTGERQFFTLKSEEHTAQISKDIAKAIEDEFRAEGINLLSSTTTFEMGINIGDLQKVLLRNAPPSSASYVQRVGRAGRGRDKNSVCVTLCRRTKYDADKWKEPPSLMSGEVRTPTVFTENKVISQRHFNAAIFAKFLRIKVVDERALGQIKQQIRLEGFLPIEARTGIPDGWFQIRPTNLYLDFLGWLNQQKDAEILQTVAGRSLLRAIGGFDAGAASATKNYRSVLASIADELTALFAEREKLHKLGGQVSDVEHAIKNLLGSDIILVLAKRGFLPRYAFPLDVVTLETGRTRWSRDADVELSRDRGIAIAEFAPGAQVIAHKKVFTSAGLYVVSKMDRPERRWYSECPSCKQIRTDRTQEKLIGPCGVCQRPITPQYIRAFVEPLAFSVRIDEKQGIERYRRSTLIRQRQSLTHFIDHVDESSFQDRGLFRLALKEAGTLFRYNLGPENKGFMLCPECGCSEPNRDYLRNHKTGKKHKRLRPTAGATECGNDKPWTKELAYGHQFQSFCLIARPTAALGSVESLAYALQRGLCRALDLELSDIGVSWRWIANNKDRTGSEIILYDQTPGGAGFVKEGFDNWERIETAARKICEMCTCEQACYDCLKSYGNQSQHEKLNRLSVIDFFK